MQLAVTTNIDQVFAQMDRFVEQAQAVAVPRAINRLQEQAQTAGLRTIARVYGVGPRTMERYLTVRLASGRELAATMTVRGVGFPLYAFSPRQTKAGVSVQVKGRRLIVPHTFIGRMRNGHVGVYARGAYGAKSRKLVPNGKTFGRFRFGKTRLPINELFTTTPPSAFSNDDVTEAMHYRVREQASKVMAQEIRFATRGR
jgi:hypothetical protein